MPLTDYLNNTGAPPPPLAADIRVLRTLIAQTRARMASGSIDFLAGAHLISRAYNSLARLILAQYRIAPPADPDGWSELRRMLGELFAARLDPKEERAPLGTPSTSTHNS